MIVYKQDDIKEDDYISILNHLNSSGIIIYPTETSYGIGANALDNEAVRKIYRLKSRDAGKPLPILVRDLKMLIELANINRREEDIISKFWPGPLTVLFKSKKLKENFLFMSNSKFVGARISPQPFVAALFNKISFPITATSANISGEQNIDNPEEIKRIFLDSDGLKERVIFIDGGILAGGSSTIIKADKKRVEVVRAGENNIKERLLCYIKNENA